MHASTFLPLLAFALQARAQDYSDWAFGNMFSIGPTSDGVFISKATWSLVPPAVPTGATDDGSDHIFMSIWVGVSDSVSDESSALVQPLLNWSPNQESQGCPASAEEWCVDASTFTGTGTQVAQPYVAVPKGAQIDFEITASASKKTNQKVWINGELVSQQSDSTGWVPSYMLSGNECYLNTCGSMDGYTWSNISITLNEADKNFGNGLELTGASGDITSSDGGKTWTGAIKINADKFPH